MTIRDIIEVWNTSLLRPLLLFTTLWMLNGLNDALMEYTTNWNPSPWCRRIGPKTGQSWDIFFNIRISKHPEIALGLEAHDIVSVTARHKSWRCSARKSLVMFGPNKSNHRKPKLAWRIQSYFISEVLRSLDPYIPIYTCIILYHPKWWKMIQNGRAKIDLFPHFRDLQSHGWAGRLWPLWNPWSQRRCYTGGVTFSGDSSQSFYINHQPIYKVYHLPHLSIFIKYSLTVMTLIFRHHSAGLLEVFLGF